MNTTKMAAADTVSVIVSGSDGSDRQGDDMPFWLEIVSWTETGTERDIVGWNDGNRIMLFQR
jgi:hypothetical protein